MAVTKSLPDPNEPLTEYEKALLEKLFLDPTQFPAKFKAWLTDYVGSNATIHPDSMPSLAGEEWHEIGELGTAFGTAASTNWSNYGSGFETVGFMKDVTGYVHLKGLALVTTGTPTSSQIFTLPAGYRPPLATRFPQVIGNNAGVQTLGALAIAADGGITPLASADGISAYHVFLDGVTFRAA